MRDAMRQRPRNGLVMIALRVPRELAGRLERDALRDGRSVSGYVRRLVERAVRFGIGIGTHYGDARARKGGR